MYIQPNTNHIHIQLREGKPLPKMPKVKRSDIPKEYRRPIWDIVLHWGVWVTFALFTINCILFFANI